VFESTAAAQAGETTFQHVAMTEYSKRAVGASNIAARYPSKWKFAVNSMD